MGVDASSLTSGLSGASLQIASFMEKNKAQFQAVGAALTAVGGTIVGGLTASVANFTTTGTELDNLHDKTGMTVDTLSKLSYAAGQTGADMSNLETSAKFMAKSITDVSGGSAAAQKALGDLGLNLKDLQSMSPDQQFMTIADALANVTDKTQQSALAQAVFGKSATDLLPMLAGGSAGLQDMFTKAQQLGVVMTGPEADAARTLSQAFGNVKESIKGLSENIGSTLAPILTSICDKITKVVEAVTNWMKAHPELSKNILILVGVVGVFAAVLGPILIALPMLAAALG